jgi:hypothetical protein
MVRSGLGRLMSSKNNAPRCLNLDVLEAGVQQPAAQYVLAVSPGIAIELRPSVIMLTAIYWMYVIILHRPFMMGQLASETGPETSLQKVKMAASSLVWIIQCMQQSTHGLRIPLTMQQYVQLSFLTDQQCGLQRWDRLLAHRCRCGSQWIHRRADRQDATSEGRIRNRNCLPQRFRRDMARSWRECKSS